MHLTKVHGTGNDFVVWEDLAGTEELDAAFTRALCTPHTGIGADGVIRLAPPRLGVDADVFMDYRNADGSLSEMCGNGVRCVAKWLVDRGIVDGDVVRVDTRGGVKPVEVIARHADGRVAVLRVDMGAPVLGDPIELDFVLPAAEPHPSASGLGAVTVAELRQAQPVSMGNPHAVIAVHDVDTAPLAAFGPALQSHPAFPDGVNVEVIAADGPGRIRGRIWERGVGETHASGTGASAMAVGAHAFGLADTKVTVVLAGGELEVDFSGDTLFVIGPAVEVATFRLDDAWLIDAVAEARAELEAIAAVGDHVEHAGSPQGTSESHGART